MYLSSITLIDMFYAEFGTEAPTGVSYLVANLVILSIYSDHFRLVQVEVLFARTQVRFTY